MLIFSYLAVFKCAYLRCQIYVDGKVKYRYIRHDVGSEGQIWVVEARYG